MLDLKECSLLRRYIYEASICTHHIAAFSFDIKRDYFWSGRFIVFPVVFDLNFRKFGIAFTIQWGNFIKRQIQLVCCIDEVIEWLLYILVALVASMIKLVHIVLMLFKSFNILSLRLKSSHHSNMFSCWRTLLEYLTRSDLSVWCFSSCHLAYLGCDA